MTTKSKVIVPDHIEKERNTKEKVTKTESETDKAFVSPEDRVLDPT